MKDVDKKEERNHKQIQKYNITLQKKVTKQQLMQYWIRFQNLATTVYQSKKKIYFLKQANKLNYLLRFKHNRNTQNNFATLSTY